MKMNVMWLSWENHRRSDVLADYFGARKFFFVSTKGRLLKHPIFILKTFFCLIKNRPKVLIVQNPSVILSFFVTLWKKIGFFSYNLVIDCHNEGVLPFYQEHMKYYWIYKFIHKNSDLNIVTNSYLADIVKKNGGDFVVLPDKLPSPPVSKKIDLKGRFNFVFVCTFAKDEPFENIIRAADQLSDDTYIYITGNFKKFDRHSEVKAPNVVFTGFLSEEEYWAYLASADCIIDLTTMDNCIVCGAYEALSLEKPMVLSDTRILRETFPKGVVYAKSDVESLANAMKEMQARREELTVESRSFLPIFSQEWERHGQEVRDWIREASA